MSSATPKVRFLKAALVCRQLKMAGRIRNVESRSDGVRRCGQEMRRARGFRDSRGIRAGGCGDLGVENSELDTVGDLMRLRATIWAGPGWASGASTMSHGSRVCAVRARGAGDVHGVTNVCVGRLWRQRDGGRASTGTDSLVSDTLMAGYDRGVYDDSGGVNDARKRGEYERRGAVRLLRLMREEVDMRAVTAVGFLSRADVMPVIRCGALADGEVYVAECWLCRAPGPALQLRNILLYFLRTVGNI